MKRSVLSVLVVVLFFVLGSILLIRDRTISKWIEACGQFISAAFGF